MPEPTARWSSAKRVVVPVLLGLPVGLILGRLPMHFLGVFSAIMVIWLTYNLISMPRQRPCDVCGNPEAFGVPKVGSRRRLFTIGWHRADTMFVCHEHVISYLRLQAPSSRR